MAATALQRYLAEFLGTFGLLLFGGGTAVTSLTVLAGGLQGVARVGIVSMAFGLVVTALAYAFGDISGAQFNPAVTLSMAYSRRMPLGDVVPYLLAQLFGGIVGIAVVAGILYGAPSDYAIAQGSALGSQCFAWSGLSPAPPNGCAYSVGSVFLLEVALTFVFVLVIQLATRAEGAAKSFAPLAIGVALLVTNLVAIPVDGASINPVRSFAPALLAAAWPSARWAIEESWLFWLAPILGGLLASVAERLFRPPTGAA